MNIPDCFDRVKTAVAAAQSTLSKRSIARAPKSTRRQIRAFEAVMSLNNLRGRLRGNSDLELKIQAARDLASSAAHAVCAGDLLLAQEQMATVFLMVKEAEALCSSLEPSTLSFQSDPLKLYPEGFDRAGKWLVESEVGSCEATSENDELGDLSPVEPERQTADLNLEGNQ